MLHTELYLWNTTRTKPWATPTPIQFQVVDWCAPPPSPIGPHMGIPCPEVDKNYKWPLNGEITFWQRNRQLAIFRALFHGTLVDNSLDSFRGCSQAKPVNSRDVAQQLHLLELGRFLGGVIKVVTMEKQDNDQWQVLVQNVSSKRKFEISLDECGSIYSLDTIIPAIRPRPHTKTLGNTAELISMWYTTAFHQQWHSQSRMVRYLAVHCQRKQFER